MPCLYLLSYADIVEPLDILPGDFAAYVGRNTLKIARNVVTKLRPATPVGRVVKTHVIVGADNIGVLQPMGSSMKLAYTLAVKYAPFAVGASSFYWGRSFTFPIGRGSGHMAQEAHVLRSN